MFIKPFDPCSTCPGFRWGKEFVPADGSGENGVLIVLEAAGEHEAKEGKPVVGKAGYYLFQNLKRAGIDRDGFRIANVLCCRPPNNKLAGMPYEEAVIASCSPLLDATIADMRLRCAANGKTFTILTLGRTAFKRIMGLKEKDPLLRSDYLCYPHWHATYKAWVIAADHPSYLMRGNNHLIPVLQFAAQRALEIAANGLTLDTPQYLLDPSPSTFAQWVLDFRKHAEHHPDVLLSYDIETPYKQGKDEEDVAKEDDSDYTILRCSFSYTPNEGISVPWQASYKPILEDLFAHPCAKAGWNSESYDYPRVSAQMPMSGDQIDGMLMWHVLNSALPKGLGFVTPFYAKRAAMWKHLSQSQPAFYNAKDADMALQNILGIQADLQKTDLWKVFDRHVVQLNRVLSFMSKEGVLLDQEGRKAAEVQLSGLLDGVEHAMEAAIPPSVRKHKVYQKEPKDTTGLIQVLGKTKLATCPKCGATRVKADHFKSIGKKRLKAGETERWCHGFKAEKREYEIALWAKPLDFKVSVKSLTSYQKALKHQAILNRREHRITFDEDAIKKLVKAYPSDPLYPNILKHREYTKLLSTYIGVEQANHTIRGGMQLGKDAKVHPFFSHNPSTLRLACQNPNMQNLPRATGRPDDLQNLVRNLIIASPGCKLVEFDYSAIEAVLVGYFAEIPEYIRLAKMGIHSFLASHVLKRPADLKWSDSDLKAYFKEIKKSDDPEINLVYNGCKRAIHLTGYGGSPRKMHQAEPQTFPSVKYAEELQAIYFDLFPNIKHWQMACQLQAEKAGFLRNPYGYIHRFYRVFSYAKECGKWVRKQGDDQNRVLAFLPQSTAAGIIKEAMLRLYYDRFNDAGQFLRLQVHDSLVSDVPNAKVEEVSAVIQQEMEQPIPELRLPTSYNMGAYLSIDTERKVGVKWGSMH